MPFPTIGGITIDTTVQLDTDPAIYEPQNWKKRESYHPTVGGGGVTQDFGLPQKDLKLSLASGPYGFIQESTRAALQTRYATKGATYVLTDWLGNTFTVFIVDFTPVPWKQGRDSAGNLVRLYTYKMPLRVITITNLFGVAYSGL